MYACEYFDTNVDTSGSQTGKVQRLLAGGTGRGAAAPGGARCSVQQRGGGPSFGQSASARCTYYSLFEWFPLFNPCSSFSFFSSLPFLFLGGREMKILWLSSSFGTAFTLLCNCLPCKMELGDSLECYTLEEFFFFRIDLLSTHLDIQHFRMSFFYTISKIYFLEIRDQFRYCIQTLYFQHS